MIRFIPVAVALEIHDALISAHGGFQGIRDYGLLLSALEMPKSSFEGQDLHPTLFDKAAAYLYHVTKNHPFIDGNKRTAAALALVFLEMNQIKLKMNAREYEELVVATAEGVVSKKEIAVFFVVSSNKNSVLEKMK
jgi:death on curing protein